MTLVSSFSRNPNPLRVSRTAWRGGAELVSDSAQGSPLGALLYARGEAKAPSWLHTLRARPLLSGSEMADLWHTTAPLQTGSTGLLGWQASKDWLFGGVDLSAEDEADGGIEGLAYRVYRDLFVTLREHGQPELLRLWNYLPHITGDGDGMERYRRFNSGRQQAFLEAKQAAFEGAPAACALGLREGGGLSLRFVAGHTVVRAIENPRQTPAWRYPSDYGPHAPTFSRAALASLGAGQLALLVSGTASIVGHASLHAGNTLAQLAETLRNLRAVFDAARAQCDAPFSLERSEPVIYLRHAGDAEAVREQLALELGAASQFMRQAVFIEADICRPDLDIEIETQACETGCLHPA